VAFCISCLIRRLLKQQPNVPLFIYSPLPSLSFEIDFQSIHIFHVVSDSIRIMIVLGSELNQYSESAVTTWTLSTMRLSAIQVALVIAAVRVTPCQNRGPSKVSLKYFMLLWVSEVLFMSALNHKTLKWPRNLKKKPACRNRLGIFSLK
jgi:hypothetical protein